MAAQFERHAPPQNLAVRRRLKVAHRILDAGCKRQFDELPSDVDHLSMCGISRLRQRDSSRKELDVEVEFNGGTQVEMSD